MHGFFCLSFGELGLPNIKCGGKGSGVPKVMQDFVFQPLRLFGHGGCDSKTKVRRKVLNEKGIHDVLDLHQIQKPMQDLVLQQ